MIPASSVRWVPLAAALVMVASGCVFPGGEAPRGHEHSVFQMYEYRAQGANESFQRIAFSDPAFDYPRAGDITAHLHVSGSEAAADVQDVIHRETPHGARKSLGEFFGSLGITMESGGVMLHPEVHGQRVLGNDSTRAWRLYVDACGDGPDTWKLEGAFQDYVPRHHDRMLLVYALRVHDGDDLASTGGRVPTHASLGSAFRESC